MHLPLAASRPLPSRRRSAHRCATFFTIRRLVFAVFVLPGLAAVAHAQSRLTNLSVRAGLAGGDTLIVGFAVSGPTGKPILVRGIGPSLANFGLTDALADPRLTLYRGSAGIAENDDWGGGATLAEAFRATGAFALGAGSRDAALLQPLTPNAYSVHLTAATGSGIALIECYDTQPGTGTAWLSNLSARSISGTGANVLTVGFSISGPAAKPVLIRGIGPTLASFGVGSPLPNPRLRLFDNTGTEIADNAAWLSSATPSALFTSSGAFALPVASRDAAVFLGLPPGTYTAQVGSATDITGPALVEIYEVASPPVPFVTLQPIQQSAASAPDDPGAGTLSSGADAQPAPTFQARPQYPVELRAASVTGTALVDFYVKTDGTVANAVSIRATDIRFATAAVAAVGAWRFNPGRRSGRLVVTHLQVPIVFSLSQ
jgi:TonB family protein